MDKTINFRQNVHAVIIGINKYQDQKIPDLNFARADAEGVYQVLTDTERGRIPLDNVTLLLDEEATQRNIRSAIGTKIPRRAGENDMVYVFYAGHGSPVMDPKSRFHDGMEKYLVPADAELDDLRATGISMDEIQKFFGWIESKQIMFFIDSCYSGEAGGRTFQHPHYKGRHLLSTEFLEDLAGEGRLVITACDVNEVSLETPDIGHGLFSYYLIEGLKGVADRDQDGLVTTHELYDYVYENVSEHARKMGGSMHPIQKGSTKGKIFLTYYETAAQKQAKALHAQAQSYYDAGKFDEAYDLWQRTIKLMPEHEQARHGIQEISRLRQDEYRKKQESLEHKLKVLLNLYNEGTLPSREFDRCVTLLEKDENELNTNEIKIRRLIDDLADQKISSSSYLKSVKLLTKPEFSGEQNPTPKSVPKIQKEDFAPPTIPSVSEEQIVQQTAPAKKIWLSLMLITIGWGIVFVISGLFIELGGELTGLTGIGASCGLITALGARRIQPSINWKQVLIVVFSWAMGSWAISSTSLYVTTNFGFVFLYVFAISGLFTGFAMKPHFKWNQVFIVSFGWIISGIIGFVIWTLFTHVSTVDLHLRDAPIELAILGALTGAIGGGILFWQLSHITITPKKSTIREERKRRGARIGIVLVVIGILGFIVPGIGTILTFHTHHNLIHIISGAVLAYLGFKGSASAQSISTKIFGIGYGIMTIWGFMGNVNLGPIILHLDVKYNLIHLVITAACLWVGFTKKKVTTTA